MKKVMALLVVALLISSMAFAAVVPSVQSRQRYEDSSGTSYERVIGTLAFDSTYPCNGISCGETFGPRQMLGLTSITKMTIDPAYTGASSANGYVTFLYKSSGVDGNNLSIGRLFGVMVISGAAQIVSSPSGDYSSMTAVPFEAVGPVL